MQIIEILGFIVVLVVYAILVTHYITKKISGFEHRLNNVEETVKFSQLLDRRLMELEANFKVFNIHLTRIVANGIAGSAPGNPIDEKRWQYLLNKWTSQELNADEARELFDELQKQEQDAKQVNDTGKLLLIGLGIALLAVILNKAK